jgi:hypothetical protein
MLTTKNYFQKVAAINIAKLPANLKEGYEFVKEVTENHSTWNYYHSDTDIKNTVDEYLESVSVFLSKDSSKNNLEHLAREEAKNLIRGSVQNGESFQDIRKSYLGTATDKVWAQVDGSKIRIEKLNGQKSRYSFPLMSIYNELLEELKKEPSSGSKSTTSTSNKTTDKNSGSSSSKSIKLVAKISEEVKFIKRYLALHGKVKFKESILTIIKSLQRAIVQKVIRKTSPLASEIEKLQRALIAKYNGMKDRGMVTIHKGELAKLVAIVGGEKTFSSLNIIKRYISLEGKSVDAKLKENFINHIKRTIDKKNLRDDPYANEVKSIYKALRSSKRDKTFSIREAELSGLQNIVKDCSAKNLGHIYHIKRSQAKKSKRKLRECVKRTFSDSKGKGTCSHNGGLSGVPTDSRILTAEQMSNRKHDLLDFTSFWLALFGRPERNFTLMVHGEPFNGKTLFLLMFAKYLAQNFGYVLYVSSEEFGASTMTDKITNFVNPKPVSLHFIDSLQGVDLSPYDFIILDSVNDLDLKPTDYKDIVKEYPDKGYILNLQHTKAGKFRGGKDWEHIPAIVAEVSKGNITLTKNRYGNKGTLNFFKQFGLEWKEPEPIEDAVQVAYIPESNEPIDTSEDEPIY